MVGLKPLNSAAALLGMFLWASPASATILFSDNFDGGASAAWGDQSGDWRTTGGVYDAGNPDNSPITYTDVTTLPGLTDFSLSVDVNSVDDGGVWLRSSYNAGSISGVLLVTGGSTGSNNGLYWHTVVNGAFSGIQQAVGIPGLQDSNIQLRIDVAGDTYSAFVNGNAVAATTLTTNLFASGSAGLYDYSPTNGAGFPLGQTFDNFSIADFASVSEPGTFALMSLTLAGLGLARRKRAMNPKQAT